ncbi:hypothetical protein LNV09_12670 [Paucibacter sp. B2R-40]|uniref:hypothetical protein n=1 Tax=Paucibacter sp. B2R-40 TaxID=2893554 RepID=UPI0021E36452|nr:hypothetical protein [Paucibacter sp. B2R-40]MCV2355010.1 hypothetical protein [Paucibacter sp. B2R-40]
MDMASEFCEVATLRCAFSEGTFELMIAGMLCSCFSYEDSRPSADVIRNIQANFRDAGLWSCDLDPLRPAWADHAASRLLEEALDLAADLPGHASVSKPVSWYRPATGELEH